MNKKPMKDVLRPPSGDTNKETVSSYRAKVALRTRLINWPAPIYDRPVSKPAYSGWPVECLFAQLGDEDG